jgi:hypothetical protein
MMAIYGAHPRSSLQECTIHCMINKALNIASVKNAHAMCTLLFNP